MDKDDLKRELRGAGKQATAEVTRELIGLFIAWVRTRPIKTAILRRREARKAKKSA